MFIDREEYIGHINDRKQIENMRRVIDKIEIVLKRHKIESTDFLNPYERKLAKSILNRFEDISYKEIGGLDNSERKIISIYQEYYFLANEDIDIKYYEIYDYISDFNHRDLLGSLMSLGINREKIGDILVLDNRSQIALKKEISEYVFYNFKKVGKENIKIKEICLENLEEGQINFKEKQSSIASMRLDAVVSALLNISRSEGQRLINSTKIKINWEPIENVSYDLEEGDIISIQGFGRFILYSIDGVSRKGRNLVTTRKLI